MSRHPLTWGGWTEWLNRALVNKTPIFQKVTRLADEHSVPCSGLRLCRSGRLLGELKNEKGWRRRRSGAGWVQHQSMLHLIGGSDCAQDGERSTELAASEIIAGADLVAPSTANITGGLYRRGGRRCNFGRLSATFCECRRAPSTQVKTADLARHS
jgi:hypothetical protein